MQTLCPKCEKKYAVPDNAAGKQVRCKNDACRNVFTIEPLAAEAPILLELAPPEPAPAGNGNLASLLSADMPPVTGPDMAAANLPTYARPKKPSKLAKLGWKLPAMLGGGVLALIVAGFLLYLVVSRLFGSSFSSLASYCFPEDTQFIAYANVAQLLDSDLASDLDSIVGKQAMQMEGDFSIKDVSEMFAAGTSFASDGGVVVVRMKKDCELKSFLPKQQREQPLKTFKGITYSVAGNQWGGRQTATAKIGDRTVCEAPSEEMLKDIISRIDRKERVKLDKTLQAELDAAAGAPIYAAGINARLPVFGAIEAFHFRAWIGSSVQIEAKAVFADAKYAGELKQKIDDRFKVPPGVAIPPEVKKDMETMREAISIRRNGRSLYVDAKWKTKDIKALINKNKPGSNPFPGPPRASVGDPSLLRQPMERHRNEMRDQMRNSPGGFSNPPPGFPGGGGREGPGSGPGGMPGPPPGFPGPGSIPGPGPGSIPGPGPGSPESITPGPPD